MKAVIINATEREDLGGKYARKLRKEGGVPCVIYGGDATMHFSAPELNFKHLIYTSSAAKAEINVGDKKIEAIVQDIQFHPVTDKILHIDFIELIDGKPVTMAIPVKLEGNSRGVKNGGSLNHFLRSLKVKSNPSDLPESIVINVEELRIGEAIRVGDLPKSSYEFLSPESAVVVAVRMSRGAVDEEEEEGEEEASAEGESEEKPAAE